MLLQNLLKLKRALLISCSLILVTFPLIASTSATENEMSDASFSYLLDLARDEHEYRYPTALGCDALYAIASTPGHTKRFGAAYFLYSLEDDEMREALGCINFGEGKENWITEVKTVLTTKLIASRTNHSSTFGSETTLKDMNDPQKFEIHRILDIMSIERNHYKDTYANLEESLDENILYFQGFGQCLLKNDEENLALIAQDNTHIFQFEAAYELHSKGNPQSGSIALQSIASDHAHSRQWDALVALWRSPIKEDESFAHDVFTEIALKTDHPLRLGVSAFFTRFSRQSDQLLGFNILRSLTSLQTHFLPDRSIDSITYILLCNPFPLQENVDAITAIYKEIASNNDHPMQFSAIYFFLLSPSDDDLNKAFGHGILKDIALNDASPIQLEAAILLTRALHCKKDFGPVFGDKDSAWKALRHMVLDNEHPLQFEASMFLSATKKNRTPTSTCLSISEKDDVKKLAAVGLRRVIENEIRTPLEKEHAAAELFLSSDESDQKIGQETIRAIARPDMTLLSLLAQDDCDASDEWKATEHAAIILEDSADPTDQDIAQKTLTTLARYKARKAGLDEDFIQSHRGG